MTTSQPDPERGDVHLAPVWHAPRTDETALLISLDCERCRITVATAWNDTHTRYCSRCGCLLKHEPKAPCGCKRCAGPTG